MRIIGAGGEILSLAPNFDNNMALISQGYPKNVEGRNDALVRLFNELMAFDSSLKQYVPKLSEEIIRRVLKRVNMKVRSGEIVRFVMNGYNQIERS